MKIVILHDELSADARPDETDALVQAECVATALAELGHNSVAMGCTLNLRDLGERLGQQRPDCVFNLVESLAGHGRLVHLVPALLDSLDIPYTGAGTEAMFLTASKTLCKQLLDAHGLPTPLWFAPAVPVSDTLLGGGHPCLGGERSGVGGGRSCLEDECQPLGGGRPARRGERKGSRPIVEHPETADSMRPAFAPGPYIIKSVWEEASVGLEDDSVARFDSAEALLEALDARRASLGGSAFAEQYIDGREFNLSVITGGDVGRVLPPAEIRFVDFAPDKPKIVGYSAKWREETHEFNHTPRTFDFPESDSQLLEELMTLAERCWNILGLRGYARVDFRVDADGRPFILEVNANPCLSPDAGFAAATARAGLPFTRAIDLILSDATGW